MSTDSDSNVDVLAYNNMIDPFLQYIQDMVSNESLHDITASMDFEFDRNWKTNTHDMALAQIMFTYSRGKSNDNSTEHSKAYLVDFRMFSKKKLEIFERLVLSNPKVLKILHGSESLDLPALKKLMSSENSFKSLLAQMVDTRYLCEVHHILLEKKTGKRFTKCNIYDSLKHTNVITDEQYRELTSIKINYNKPWKIQKLTEKQITYAVADIAFLHNLYVEYFNLIGIDMIDLIMNSFQYGILTRMGIVKLPHSKRKTADLIEQLQKNNVLKTVVAKSPMGGFTIGDLIKIDYLRKSALRLAYDTLVDKK